MSEKEGRWGRQIEGLAAPPAARQRKARKCGGSCRVACVKAQRARVLRGGNAMQSKRAVLKVGRYRSRQWRARNAADSAAACRYKAVSARKARAAQCAANARARNARARAAAPHRPAYKMRARAQVRGAVAATARGGASRSGGGGGGRAAAVK